MNIAIPRTSETPFRCLKTIAQAALLALMLPVSAWAVTYYVDPAGNDANNGTSTATPWQTLGKVNATTFAPGDQILLKAGGIWSGQLHPLGSGTNTNPIIINRYGTGNKPCINGPGTNESAGVLILDQTCWEINNLEVTNTQTAGGTNRLTGILIRNSGTTVLNHFYVRDCYVHNVNSAPVGTNYDKGTGGIIIKGGPIYDTLVEGNYIANVTVEGTRTGTTAGAGKHVFRDNFIENVYGDGIVINPSNGNSLIEYNVLYNTCMSNAGAFAGAWTYSSFQTTVQYNEVYGLVGGGGDGEPFDADENTNGDIFQYNYSHDNMRGFILVMPSASNPIFRYNISQNDTLGTGGNGGANIFEIRNGSTHIYNNVFYIGSGETINSVIYFPTAHTVDFRNNIFFAEGTVQKFANVSALTTSTFLNNCFYPASIIAVNGPTGTVSGNITSNPQFVSPGTGGTGMAFGSNGFATAQTGYKLALGSPALGTGVLISGGNGGFDYWGNPVLSSAPPNIGAYNGSGEDGSMDILPTADAHVRNGSYANTNYGTATTLDVKADATSYFRKSYLKFEISAASSVGAATLGLYVASTGSTSSRTISVYAVPTTTWSETTITWNNAPAAGTLLGSFGVSNVAGVWYDFDVTSYVQSEKSAGRNTVSFLLINNGSFSSTNQVNFASKEAATGQPELAIMP